MGIDAAPSSTFPGTRARAPPSMPGCLRMRTALALAPSSPVKPSQKVVTVTLGSPLLASLSRDPDRALQSTALDRRVQVGRSTFARTYVKVEMVGYDSEKSFGKPSRSEELGTPEVQEEHARKVRAYLEANAPKRMVKPPRSDADDMMPGMDHGDESVLPVFDPPERMKYLQLLATGVPLETLGSGEVDEDYTESEYYTYMAAIDKEHHTTGTGFIKVDKTPHGFHLHVTDPQGSLSFRERYQCNPAMNDWEPAQDPSVYTISNKPLRSESGDLEL